MNKKKLQVWLPLLISISVVIGMFAGFKMRDGMPGKSFFYLDRQRPIQELIKLIDDKYVDPVNTNQLSDTAIAAILKNLDPHSVYIPASELDDVNDEIKGSFYGIGIEFNMLDDTMHVIYAIKDGPGFKAGLQRGDKIIKAGNKVIAGVKLEADSIRKLLRGGYGSDVQVTILRNGSSMEKNIKRDQIPMNSVDAAFMTEDGIGYIRLNKFSTKTYREFMTSLDGLKNKGLKKLVLDLRGNGGGVLDEAVEIADEFLDGDKLITYTQGRSFPKKEYRCRREGLFEKGDLVVLADESSASASEVLIGALQDWDRATIVGRRTFGKGLVQEQYNLSDRSAVRLTVARYYTPSGRSIQRSYTNGGHEYYKEIIDRQSNGDSLEANVPHNDSAKKYRTMAGKVVYGGGGIAPDVHVANDTNRLSPSLSNIFLKNLSNQFGYRLLVAEPALEKSFTDLSSFSNNFQITEQHWNFFRQIASKDSINWNKLTPNDKAYLQTSMKASVARQIWRNDGFFEVYRKADEAMLKAWELLKK